MTTPLDRALDIASNMAENRSQQVPLPPLPRWTMWAIAAAPVALLFMLLAGSTTVDLDMFHEMALAREAFQTGSIAHEDVYAYTPTVSPVVHHEWGTGVVLYLIAVVAGWGGTGVLVLRFLLIAGVAACCYWCARARGAESVLIAALSPVAIALTAVGTTPVRAHMFTFLFLACLLVLFEWDRWGNRWWPAVWLPLYLVWVNMHGGFVVGAGIFALYTLERFGRALGRSSSVRTSLSRTRHLFLTGIVMAFLPLINPYGWDYVPYLWHALLLDRPLVAEWAPIWDPRVQWEYVLIFGASLLLVAYAALRADRPLQLPGLLLVIAAALLATRSQRLLPVYAIVWMANVPGYLSSTELYRLMERTWRKYATPIAMVIAVGSVALFGRAVQLRFWELRVPATGADGDLIYPVGAVDYLAAQGFTGNLMTPFNSGAFVSWRLYPAVKVGMDSRYEVAYPPEAVEENVRLYSGDADWEEILSSYPTDAVLVDNGTALERLLAEAESSVDVRWHRIYQDDGFSVFVRSGADASLPVTKRIGELIVGRFP